MRALVTGADGFVGRHLVAHLRAEGDDVHEAIGLGGDAGPARHPLDVRDPGQVADIVAATQPDAIYHLAAVAYGPDAKADLASALAITVVGTAHVLEAALGVAERPFVLVTGSSEVYGAPAVERIDERSPTQPTNVYGATKLAQEALSLAFGRSHGTAVAVTRSFNHIGPGQRDSFAVASFAHQLADIGAGRQPPVLRVGNVEPVRDFTDVRDVVRAYRALVTGGHAGAAVNVASGVGIPIGDVLDRLIEASGLDVRVEVDPTRVRPDDAPRLVGDPTLIQALTGWTPSIGLDQTLHDIWEDAAQRWM